MKYNTICPICKKSLKEAEEVTIQHNTLYHYSCIVKQAEEEEIKDREKAIKIVGENVIKAIEKEIGYDYSSHIVEAARKLKGTIIAFYSIGNDRYGYENEIRSANSIKGIEDAIENELIEQTDVSIDFFMLFIRGKYIKKAKLKLKIIGV